MIEELRLKNFEGFRDEKIRFTKGLNLITGRNSVGKTTILDAVVYTLYGNVPGIESRLLVRRRKDVRNMETYLRFRSPVNGSTVEIFRFAELRRNRFTTKEVKLVIDGKEVQVEGVEDLRRRVTKLIGIGYKTFNWIIYSRQGRLNEVLDPRKEDMDSILEITLLRELSEEFSEVIKEFKGMESEYGVIKSELMPLKEKRVEELRREIEEISKEVGELREYLKRSENPAARRLLRKVRELEKERIGLAETERAIRVTLQRYGLNKLEGVKREYERLGEEYMEMKAGAERLRAEVDEIRQTEERIRGRLETLRRSHENHLRLRSEGVARCPTCGQPISEKILGSIIDGERRELEKIGDELRRLRVRREGLEKRLEDIQLKLDEVERRKDRLKVLLNTISAYEAEIKDKERIIRSLEVEVEGLIKRLGVDLSPKEPKLYEKLTREFQSPEWIEEKKRRLNTLELRLREKREELEKVEREVEELGNRLKELERKSMIASIASSLRERIAESIETIREKFLRGIALRAHSIFMSLTDQRIYTAFMVDPQNYRVYVRPYGLSDFIPAVRVGGGHQTLISISIRLAILSYLGINSLIILDEPTYGVDEENLQILLNQLSRLTKHVSQALIITHYGRGVEEASNIIEVYKDEEGCSRIKTTV